MVHHDDCDDCANPAKGFVRSPLLPRWQALSLYVRLQRQGYLPSMCERESGQCRVCYRESQRLEGKSALM